MAQRVEILLTDDLDGKDLPAGRGETVAFALDGRFYEIDLGTKNAAALRRTLAVYIEAARPIRNRRGKKVTRAAVEAVRDRGEAISLSEAARILGRPIRHVQELVESGELSSVSSPKWPVFRPEVERYGDEHPVPEGRLPSPDRIGQLNTTGAGHVLGVSVDRLKYLARTGLIPSDQDAQGRYWFRPDHLEMYQRSRAAEAAVEHFGSLPPARRSSDEASPR